MENKLTTKQQYDDNRRELEQVIAEATRLGVMESSADNPYMRRIAELAKLAADYEDQYLKPTPIREKNPILAAIDEYLFAHQLKQQDAAEMLGINVSTFSQIMNGKRGLSVSLAKKLYLQLHISAELILENI